MNSSMVTIKPLLLLQQETVSFLQSSGVGTIGLSLFMAQLPSSPTDAISVSVQGGDAAVCPHRYNVQVLCRGLEYLATATRAELLNSYLDNHWHQTVNAVGRFVADHPVGPMYRDANNLFVFTLNYTYVTAVSTA